MIEKKTDSILGIDIKKIQKIELEILIEFDRICRKHDIRYQLYAGTLIGAIRHKGFIPWDDDIDVSMLREDYHKFLSVVEEELSSEYFFQTHETDPNYINKFAKIRKNRTVFMEKLVEGIDMHHGFYIDIFTFDSVKLDTYKGKYQIWLLRTIDSFFKYRIKTRYETLEDGFEKKKATFKYHLIKILPISKEKVERCVLKIMTMFNDEKTEYVADLANPGEGVLEKFMLRRETLEDSIDWDFEEYKFPVPRAYDEVLTRAYGDYMQPPEVQVSHHNIVKIDLNTKNNKQ
ncbi:LicD family protein [Jeotgalibaca sp. MA1X17-3]|uniref:LicD family protein n=1 Tax=Jeotgalibaca sp. MA1X17-3 TaxID=2908211 RepID=UPI001F338144|nr:LicD family protein [Jeotgalibaca sp. MA1X17-3]UJF15204.1 LicD family protein [Jeotgalibaca sp. MA1X17-3]